MVAIYARAITLFLVGPGDLAASGGALLQPVHARSRRCAARSGPAGDRILARLLGGVA